ncbi:MAG: hypothetical protein LBG27_01870, partial [Spirochaetaceae bacterium]|nr:hypothetical protein [Spirochaetaceae bacterium]
GQRTFISGVVYPDITAEYAKELIAMDKKKPLGALSFFTPVDEETVNFIKAVKLNGGAVKTPEKPDGPEDTPPKPPTRAELITEAKNLGIKGADRMTAEELKEVIAAKKAETVVPEEVQDPPPPNAEVPQTPQ